MLKRLLINPKMRGFAVVLEETHKPMSASGTILGIYPTEDEADRAAQQFALDDPEIVTDPAKFDQLLRDNARRMLGIPV